MLTGDEHQPHRLKNTWHESLGLRKQREAEIKPRLKMGACWGEEDSVFVFQQHDRCLSQHPAPSAAGATVCFQLRERQSVVTNRRDRNSE